MTPYEVFEKLALAGVFAVVVWVAFGKLMPGLRARLRAALASVAARRGHAALARWLAPTASAGGCGSGCGSCSSCGPAPADAAGKTVPIRLHGIPLPPRS
ncbi:DUF6587 family protein [Derxia lacustris]|uniref:DUF6587 family protein n=1 Tax=Derxia lacustris TaxID=764842 RepID=UPI00111C458A|nr:DUF6587 family protein [Derxia lacustris]